MPKTPLKVSETPPKVARAHTSPRNKLPAYTPAECSQLGRLLQSCLVKLVALRKLEASQIARENLQKLARETLTREAREAFRLFPDFAGYSKKALHLALILNDELEAVPAWQLVESLEGWHLSE